MDDNEHGGESLPGVIFCLGGVILVWYTLGDCEKLPCVEGTLPHPLLNRATPTPPVCVWVEALGGSSLWGLFQVSDSTLLLTSGVGIDILPTQPGYLGRSTQGGFSDWSLFNLLSDPVLRD